MYTYSIACHSPGYVASKVTYHLSLVYEDGKGARTIAFQGVKGRNTLMYDMVWTAVKFVNKDVIVDVSGFDPKKSYVCEFVDESNSNVKRQTDSKFLDNNKVCAACAAQPRSRAAVAQASAAARALSRGLILGALTLRAPPVFIFAPLCCSTSSTAASSRRGSPSS